MKMKNRNLLIIAAVATGVASALTVGALLFSSCSHMPASGGRSIASSDAEMPSLNFSLYKDEAWEGGSAEAEEQIFMRQMQDVAVAQQNLQKKRKSSQADRVFHQKTHGCVIGTLKIRDNDQAIVANSMFSGSKKSYTVLARFSNGVGISESDLLPDVRGIGIKIFGVHDNQDGTDKTMDINMTNSPVPFGDDTEDFVEFMKAKDDPGVSQLSYFRTHPRVGLALFKATLKYISSLTQIQFWSGHPYLLVDTAMKLNIRPEVIEPQEDNEISSHYPANIEDWSLPNMLKASAKLEGFLNSMAIGDLHDDWERSQNYLHDDLAQRLSQGQVRYVMSIQLEKDPVSTPIEKNLTEWKESITPSIPVADLVFERQKLDDPQLQQVCQEARFTPGHYVSQHRPLSNMGRRIDS